MLRHRWRLPEATASEPAPPPIDAVHFEPPTLWTTNTRFSELFGAGRTVPLQQTRPQRLRRSLWPGYILWVGSARGVLTPACPPLQSSGGCAWAAVRLAHIVRVRAHAHNHGNRPRKDKATQTCSACGCSGSAFDDNVLQEPTLGKVHARRLWRVVFFVIRPSRRYDRPSSEHKA